MSQGPGMCVLKTVMQLMLTTTPVDSVISVSHVRNLRMEKCIINHHKFSILKQYIFIISYFLWVRTWA